MNEMFKVEDVDRLRSQAAQQKEQEQAARLRHLLT